MKNLYVFYSRTSKTEAVILKCKELIGGDERVVRVSPKHGYGGAFGFLRALGTMFRKKPVELKPGDPVNLAEYDRVIIATPVWADRAAAPMRAFLQTHKGAKAAAYIAVMGGSGPCTALFDELDELTGVKREAAVVIEGMGKDFGQTLTEFVGQLSR